MDFDSDFSSPLYTSFFISSTIGFCPPIPKNILPPRPVLKHIKDAIKFVEQKYGEKVEVSRWDGKKLPSTKHDYLMALANYRPSPLPLDTLLVILSYSPFPTQACLISKEVARHVNRECFYQRVCSNLGYDAITMTSQREFFLLWTRITRHTSLSDEREDVT